MASRFAKNVKADPGLKAGIYPAKALFDANYSEVKDMDFGPTINLCYLVFRGKNKAPMQQYELASFNTVINQRFMKRMAVINGEITENTDLSQLRETGWGLLKLEPNKKNPEYLKVADFTEAPEGYVWPDGTIAGEPIEDDDAGFVYDHEPETATGTVPDIHEPEPIAEAPF